VSDEKTEKPTPKKRKENRKEGKVPRSQEIGAWSALAAFAFAMPVLMKHEISELKILVLTDLTLAGSATPEKALALAGEGLWHVFLVLLLLGAGVLLISFLGSIAQGGFFLATKSVKPKASKINPIAGAKRIFGMRALWEGAKMILRSGVVALLVWLGIEAMLPLVGGLVPMDAVIDQASGTAMSMVRNIAVAGVILAGADYLVQRYQTGKQTRMSKHDVKQEHKQSEGDPLVKSAIRSRQLAAARNRMMADVPTADVVLVNPTHVAVALRYEPEKGAPRVVALGAGVIAQSIREKAAEARVPLVRDVPLARALYTSTKVGQEIPAELFAAVAQVLAYVISRRTKGQYGGEHRTPRTGPDLPAVTAASRRRRRPAAPAT